MVESATAEQVTAHSEREDTADQKDNNGTHAHSSARFIIYTRHLIFLSHH
jgi:hypothetical protein